MQCRLILSVVLAFVLYGAAGSLKAYATDEPGIRAGLQDQLRILLAQKNGRSSDPHFLVRLADIYLDLGEDVSVGTAKRRAAYEEGAKFARQAIDLQEQNADAHYLYAANLGSAAQLTGIMASALTIRDLKHHLTRALGLNPDHAPALHMMGMMLEELPWFLGGDAASALTYLRRAVNVSPSYAHARLNLAKAYIKRNDSDSARRELDTILNQPVRGDASINDLRHREEAQRLRDSLKGL